MCYTEAVAYAPGARMTNRCRTTSTVSVHSCHGSAETWRLECTHLQSKANLGRAELPEHRCTAMSAEGHCYTKGHNPARQCCAGAMYGSRQEQLFVAATAQAQALETATVQFPICSPLDCLHSETGKHSKCSKAGRLVCKLAAALTLSQQCKQCIATRQAPCKHADAASKPS